VEPEDCLRSLTDQALQGAHPGTSLFPVSLGLMAVANAFVMLGLLPEPRAEEILAAHRAALEHKGFGNVWGVTKGELTVRPGAHEYWQSRIAGPVGLRKVFQPAEARVPVGTSDPPWPTPAEGYMAALAPATHVSIATSDQVAEAGPEETAEIIATVADSLMAVGALPAASTLLREPAFSRPGWQTALAYRWFIRTRQQTSGSPAAEHRQLEVRLPLEHATAVIESISAQGELVSIQLYGHPWVMGEYWPMITPCFQVRATDDTGNDHEGMPGDLRGGRGHEGSGTFWFWPPVGAARKSIRVTVSTLWEAAWADLELPR
jgi:hypothetical protein